MKKTGHQSEALDWIPVKEIGFKFVGAFLFVIKLDLDVQRIPNTFMIHSCPEQHPDN